MPKVRLLVEQDIDGVRHLANAVPTVSAAAATALIAAGLADADPAAVAYAESLGVPLPAEAVPVAAEAAAAPVSEPGAAEPVPAEAAAVPAPPQAAAAQ
nr:hypothetical protein [uncultured Rhodopila sp.]